MGGRMGSTYGQVADRIENALISKIDRRMDLEQVFDSMTEIEQHALLIAFGIEEPDSIHTRKWANKILAQISESRIMALSTLHLLKTPQFDQSTLSLMDFHIPKAKQVIEQTGAEGGPQRHVIIINNTTKDDDASGLE